MKRDNVHTTLERLARRLDEEGIAYAIVDGMALSIHGYTRVTQDVDVLLTPEDLEAFRQRCVGRGYVAAFPGAKKTFRDAETKVPVEFIAAGDYPGDGQPKAVVFPEPKGASIEVEGLRVLALHKLIDLKLASGLSAPHGLRDLADVQDLILHLRLPRDLAERLDASTRTEYLRLWEAAQQAPPPE